MTKNEFNNLSVQLCVRMVLLDKATRLVAADEAEALLAGLPKNLRNSPYCRGEINALNELIKRVRAN